MRNINSTYSLFNCLDNFWENLPNCLVNQSQINLLKKRAILFPPILRIGIECRMNDDKQVDLQQCIKREDDNLTHLSDWIVKEALLEDSDWNALSKFIINWVNPTSEIHKNISEIFLEMDVLPGKARIPLLFFSLNETNPHHQNDFLNNVLRDTLGENRSFYPILEQCFKLCPENACVFFAGIQFSRKVDIIRINIKNLLPQQVIPFLKNLGYVHFAPELNYWIDFVYNLSDRVRVCIDLGETIYPKIGFECFWDDQPNKDTRWEVFLNKLVSKGICNAEKAEAVLSWEKDIFPMPNKNWPEHLWIESLLKSTNEFTYQKRKISHLKLSIDPSKPPELKSYIGYGNLWLKTGISVQNKTTNKNIHPKNKTIKEAIDSGLTFILKSQKQSGAWIDFQLPPGKGDEWVTAYVGYYLSYFDNCNLESSISRAWSFLKLRFRPDLGWGYNAAHPADADSTVWAALFSSRINKIDNLNFSKILNLYFLNTGGVTTYLNKDEIIKNTKLGNETSFDGWKSLHLCVTAVYALYGDTRALNCIINHQSIDGSIVGYWWDKDDYSTAFAAEAMATKPELYEVELEKTINWSFLQLSKCLDSPTPSVFRISLLIRILLLSKDLASYKHIIDKGKNELLATQQENGSWIPSACLRVPMPSTLIPEEKTNNWVLSDQNAIFTSITVINTLRLINKRIYDS